MLQQHGSTESGPAHVAAAAAPDALTAHKHNLTKLRSVQASCRYCPKLASVVHDHLKERAAKCAPIDVSLRSSSPRSIADAESDHLNGVIVMFQVQTNSSSKLYRCTQRLHCQA